MEIKEDNLMWEENDLVNFGYLHSNILGGNEGRGYVLLWMFEIVQVCLRWSGIDNCHVRESNGDVDM